MKLITFERIENLLIKTTTYVLGLITLHLFSVSYFPNCRVHTNFGPQPTIITNYMHPAFNPYMLYILRGSFLYTKKHERFQKKKIEEGLFLGENTLLLYEVYLS